MNFASWTSPSHSRLRAASGCAAAFFLPIRREFIAAVSLSSILSAGMVSTVTIKGDGTLRGSSTAEIRYCKRSFAREEVVAALHARLVADEAPDRFSSPPNGHHRKSPKNGAATENGSGTHLNGQTYRNGNGRTNEVAPPRGKVPIDREWLREREPRSAKRSTAERAGRRHRHAS